MLSSEQHHPLPPRTEPLQQAFAKLSSAVSQSTGFGDTLDKSLITSQHLSTVIQDPDNSIRFRGGKKKGKREEKKCLSLL